MSKSKEASKDAPKWDIALEALLKEEVSKKQAAITLDDMRRLAVIHAIRFDDIMDTLLVMCLDGEWKYQNRQGQDQVISEEDVDKLFASGRIVESDLEAYTGGWLPV